ncbi:Aspartate racemase [hydrothermal vent metagenome]|uniref:Aspartate racemase n=1 Tax=hydrothermal vent metagenome TaxID=652676 RepID=A0A3B0SH33_9ZZZZ
MMKRIGLLGGMSWESSVEYERLINEGVREHLGGTASGDLIVRSYNFAEIEELQERDDWARAGEILAADAVWMEAAGAEAIVLCTNTMHKVADVIEAAIHIPLIHIADATATAVHAADIHRVAVMGTRYTMEQAFYVDRLARHGLDVMIPDEPDRTTIHDIIFEELVRGEIVAGSKRRYLDAVDRLVDRGAEGVIAGCTEIELLIGPDDVPVPFFPTTAIHAAAAVEFVLD